MKRYAVRDSSGKVAYVTANSAVLAYQAVAGAVSVTLICEYAR